MTDGGDDSVVPPVPRADVVLRFLRRTVVGIDTQALLDTLSREVNPSKRDLLAALLSAYSLSDLDAAKPRLIELLRLAIEARTD